MNRPIALPAALGWRLLAAVYDLLPLLALWFVVSAAMLLLRRGVPVMPGSAAALFELAVLWSITGVYAVLSWRLGGQTMGMRAWRLRVVDDHGEAPAWRALILRYVLASLSLAALGLGYLWALLEPQRRTWHDLITSTLVVRLQSAKSGESSRAEANGAD